MEAVWRDLRDAMRAFARAPGFTATAILSLAIGIGANTAIFSVASALLLRPLPYAHADRLVILWNRSPGLGITEDWFSTAQYFDIRTRHQGFDDLALAIGANYNLTGDGEPERIGTIRATSNLLPMLGASPALGRLFTAADDVPGRTGVAILSHGTWLRRYGGDPAAIGRTLTLNGQPYQIVGVLPATFGLPHEVLPTLGVTDDAGILLPLPLPAEAATIRNREDYNIIGRLQAGVRPEQAQAEMDALTAQLRAEHPDVYPAHGGLTFGVVPLQEQVVGGVRRGLLVLAGAVACVLVIACVNVAGLLLSRALARRKEMALRSALGASRVRLVRQALTESLLLATVGGTAGVLLAGLGLKAIRRLGANSEPRLHEIGINAQVLLFTVALSVVSGVLFGLAPALGLARVDLQRGLKGGPGGLDALHTRGYWSRRMLVVAELALAVVLLVGAGLLIRSFDRLQEVSPGFDANQVLTLELTLSGRKYADANAVSEGYRLLNERLGALPGVASVGGVSALPLSRMMSWGPISVEGRTLAGGFVNADQRIVAGAYFEAMRIPSIEGRRFTREDTRATPRVVIVDRRLAEQMWPGESAIGKRIRIGGMDARPDVPWLTVVGVVGRIKQDALDADSRMAIYFPHAQSPTRAMNLVVRSPESAVALASSVRGTVAAFDPDLPIYRVQTMRARVDASLAERRFSMLLLTVFAAVALGLAMVGTYGVMAYAVSQGARELGIRVALGATPRAILGLMVGQGLTMAVAGVGVGLVGALSATRLLRGLLFEIAAWDPATYVTIAAILGVVSLAASLAPARRAARTDPLSALKGE
ncbi:MAG: ABC transporter permease [Vicinamibacterales bacterium]